MKVKKAEDRTVFSQLHNIFFGGIVKKIDLSNWFSHITIRIYCAELCDEACELTVGGVYDVVFLGVRKFSLEYNSKVQFPRTTEPRELIPGGIQALTKEIDSQDKRYYRLLIAGSPGFDIHFNDVSLHMVRLSKGFYRS